MSPMAEDPNDSIPTRHSLLHRLKDLGDQTSWQDFFDTYWQLIYNVAAKAGLNHVEAQEVVQETVIVISKNIGEFKVDPARGSFKAWLMHQTRWRIADQFRRRGKPGQVFASAAPGDSPARQGDDTGWTDAINRIPDPAGVQLETVWDEEWAKNLTAVALEQVKRRVSAKQYQMFDLHVLQNLSVQETARTVCAGAASVYMAKYRISRLLKKAVGKLERERS